MLHQSSYSWYLLIRCPEKVKHLLDEPKKDSRNRYFQSLKNYLTTESYQVIIFAF